MSGLVTLPRGLVVREEAQWIALELERLGHTLSAEGGQLRVSDGARLEADMRAAIVRNKAHLIAIVAYVAAEP
jgi:hypothetical protein